MRRRARAPGGPVLSIGTSKDTICNGALDSSATTADANRILNYGNYCCSVGSSCSL